jgi:hypothetical protein
VTEIREPNFAVDLPGAWEQVESTEPGMFSYRETDGEGEVTVTLLAVRPMFNIADPARLVDDYLHHRPKFERGRRPSLEQSEPVLRQGAGPIEGGWDGVDLATGHRLRHRVVLAGSLLVDFRYEVAGLDEAAFDERAAAVLGSAAVTGE